MKIVTLIISTILLLSCSSTKIMSSWKNPENPIFEANKVLVIGMTSDVDNRRIFESQLSTALENRGVIAVRSVDFFEVTFTDTQQSEAALDAIEKQLLDAGFDAILFSKILGEEEKVSMVQSFRDLNDTYNGFKEDYMNSQEYYYRRSEAQAYKLFHAETNLYCICPDKARELIWSGQIDVVDHNLKKNISSYIQLLTRELEAQQLLIVQ